MMTNSDRYIPESQIREVVREAVRAELIDFFGLDPSQSVGKQYYPTDEAWALLGYSSKRALYEGIVSGLFRVGIEVQDRRKPKAKYAVYYFDIERCRKRLSELPEKRRGKL